MRLAVLVLMAALVAASCGGDDDPGAVVYFDLTGAIDTPATFFDHPFPSDLRLTSEGRPDLTGFPNPRNTPILSGLLSVAGDRHAFPANSVGYFRFTEPLAPRVFTDVIAASVDSPVLLVDIDPDSPARGSLTPTVALSLVIDDYVGGHTLAVSPRGGFVLHGERSYAYVVMRSLGDANGDPLGVAGPIADMASGKVPAGASGPDVATLYAPLWETLDTLGVDRRHVAAATVFTTADVVKDLFELSEGVRARDSVTITGLALDPDDGATHPRFCELLGTVSFPQFQVGKPPFDTEGLFEIGTDGLPVEQRQEVAPVVITIPKTPMPTAGYPLMMYFHGSGGIAAQVVDRGRVTVMGGEPTKGEGPAHVVAEHGIAAVGSAHPVSPDRLPNAIDIEYLNFKNLPAFRDTFRQGVIEQRLLLDALLALEIDPQVLAGCAGATLPNGATAFKFDPDGIVALGQSMGGMYTNLIGGVEPRIKAVVPTGAGGFWNSFILETSLIPGVRDLLSIIIGTPEPDLTFMHPGIQLLSLGWEVSDPMIYMPRLGARPLPGHPVRSVYEPVGKGDSYFPIALYDSIALAYGHQQAGDIVWPSMQEALALAGLDGIISYPVIGNRPSAAGGTYTGVVVQYEGDGIYDPHAIYGQLDEVKYQYGCFLHTFLTTGTAVVPAPAALGTPCPTAP